MFEKATKMKLRWTERGRIGVEDLWDLAPEDLDQIFKNLSRQTKAAQEESLLVTRSGHRCQQAAQAETLDCLGTQAGCRTGRPVCRGATGNDR